MNTLAWCPACNSSPGEPCTAPTSNSRREVRWIHSARQNELDKTTMYGLRCGCHGLRWFDTARERDAAAITYQCKPEWLRSNGAQQ